MCTVDSCWKRVFAMMNAFSWQNSVSLCPASFCTPRPNFPVTPGISWLPTFAFQSPMMKRTSFFFFFLVSVLEGLVGLQRTSQLQLLQDKCLGHRLSNRLKVATGGHVHKVAALSIPAPVSKKSRALDTFLFSPCKLGCPASEEGSRNVCLLNFCIFSKWNIQLFVGVLCVYKAVLVAGVQHLPFSTYLSLFIFGLFSRVHYYTVWSSSALLSRRFWLNGYFVCVSGYQFGPTSKQTLPATFSPHWQPSVCVLNPYVDFTSVKQSFMGINVSSPHLRDTTRC